TAPRFPADHALRSLRGRKVTQSKGPPEKPAGLDFSGHGSGHYGGHQIAESYVVAPGLPTLRRLPSARPVISPVESRLFQVKRTRLRKAPEIDEFIAILKPEQLRWSPEVLLSRFERWYNKRRD